MSEILTVDIDVYDASRLSETSLTHKGKHFIRKSQLKARRTLGYLQRPGHILVEYRILNAAKKAGYDFDPEVDNKSAYDPQALVAALARYGTPQTWEPEPSALARAMALTFKAFGCQYGHLVPLGLDSGLKDWIWLDKSSGLPECSKKGEAFDSDLVRAQSIANGDRLSEPCIAYHRVQHGKLGPKTRLVWGYPQSQFLLEARFAPLLLEQYLSKRTPMTLGLRKSQIGTRMAAIRNSGAFYSVDFSGFDSSIPPALISFAFEVLRSYFVEHFNEEEQRCWDKVVNYFIHTPIMMPDQEVWIKHRGVPSGSYFTSMVDSIVNYLAITYAWIVSKGEALGRDHILVLGDDSIVGNTSEVPLIKLAEAVSDLNLTMNVEKTVVGYSGKDWPHFLGHDWKWGMADRALEETWRQSCFPENPSGIKDPEERALIRAFSRSSDATSVWKMLEELLPSGNSNRFFDYYEGALWAISSSRPVETRMRPGFSAHMEEMGTLDPISVESLAYTLPMMGPYL